MALAALRAVVFDVGETLVDETRAWSELASSAGVTAFSLMGVLGGLIERDEDHRRVWSVLGVPEPALRPEIEAADVYADALECLRAVSGFGLRVGIAGNQPAGVVAQLRTAGFEADFIASSADWRIEKPDPEFFRRIIDAAGVRPSEVLYVGDRLDNDVLPAHSAGMRTAFIKRGPWGYLHAARAEGALADLRIESLHELTAALAESRRPGRVAL